MTLSAPNPNILVLEGPMTKTMPAVLTARKEQRPDPYYATLACGVLVIGQPSRRRPRSRSGRPYALRIPHIRSDT